MGVKKQCHLSPITLKNELTQLVDEIYSHPVRAFAIQASGSVDEVPMVTVAYEYFMLERNEDDYYSNNSGQYRADDGATVSPEDDRQEENI